MAIEHRILVVDDDHEFVDLLGRRLWTCGYQVTGLNHPRQAIEAASLRDYDVAVLDRGLPEIDGLQLMELLAGHIANLQVIFLTGSDGRDGEAETLARGAFSYLRKPCRLAEIEAVIQRAVENRRPVDSAGENACSPVPLDENPTETVHC